VIRAKAADAGVDVDVDSAGTAAYHVGEAPHPESVAAGRRRGYDVVGTGRQLGIEDFRAFDLIVTMDAANLATVRGMAPADAAVRIVPLRSFDPDADGPDVDDPWGGPAEGYDRMFDVIESAVDGLMTTLEG